VTTRHYVLDKYYRPICPDCGKPICPMWLANFINSNIIGCDDSLECDKCEADETNGNPCTCVATTEMLEDMKITTYTYLRSIRDKLVKANIELQEEVILNEIDRKRMQEKIEEIASLNAKLTKHCDCLASYISHTDKDYKKYSNIYRIVNEYI